MVHQAISELLNDVVQLCECQHAPRETRIACQEASCQLFSNILEHR
jgi:hypothetical protein